MSRTARAKSRRWAALAALGAAAATGCGAGAEAPEQPSAQPTANVEIRQEMAERRGRPAAVHLLNRFAFGPTAAALQEVERDGPNAWFETQLTPQKVPDPKGDALTKRFPVLTAKNFSEERQMAEGIGELRQLNKRLNESLRVLQAFQLAKHVSSTRQVQEVMTDFWLNHFNIFVRKGRVSWFAAEYVREVIRPHVLGNFKDLLVVSARHPAMLIYLDNAKSSRRGLNENYARELLELHTVGVNGGYTQQDVIETAKVLTGWSHKNHRRDPGFKYKRQWHVKGPKTVMGKRFEGAGEQEGMRLLEFLALHPSTAKHIAFKLCQRFVADEPPTQCVTAASTAFLKSKGDIKTVLRAIVQTDAFWSHRGNKLKTPLELVASALRALEAELEPDQQQVRMMKQLGQHILMAAAPTGYSEVSEDWVGAGAALARMNFGVAVAAGRIPSVEIDSDRILPLTSDKEQMVRAINSRFFAGQGSEATLGELRKGLQGLDEPRHIRAFAVAFAVGSPEFQRQ